ncbi:MAG: carboxypeptidase regulatory-like domain-containing protein [Deltaproteobacteria bacterium]|nr:carboxypeptidase regulatory-like domain-containing protein [Deltaproteobacteria bacterium]
MQRNSRISACFLAWLSLVVSGFGCGDDSGGEHGSADTMHVTGRVMLLSGAGIGSSADLGEDVDVQAFCDLNGNGRIDDAERMEAVTSSDGTYELDAKVKVGALLVIRFSYEGYAPQIRTFQLSGRGAIVADATLAEMTELQCSGDSCVADGGKLSISGVEVSGGYAKVFNPVADAARFPGPFADDQGNVLVSGVFAAFDLRDENDDPITKLPNGQTATIRMKVPVDTWPEMRDIDSGDGAITVPMYSFDEVRGIWVREGTGHIEDGDGNQVAESDLALIHDGSYMGELFSVSEVSHFSYWNVDWPIQENGCLTGVVVDDLGTPVAGAVVTVQGVNFAGVSQPIVTDESGRFCVSMRRSEAQGEDLNGNGVPGETLTMLVQGSFAGKRYQFGPEDISSSQGTCGSDGCADLGMIALDGEHEIQPKLCTVTGTVRWADGRQELSGVLVDGEDEGMTDEERDALCGQDGCQDYAMTDATGTFTLTAAMLGLLDVEAWLQTQSDDGVATYEYGAKRALLTCPTEPITLTIDLTDCMVSLPTVTYEAGTNSLFWTPSVSIATLSVQPSMGSQVKWVLVARDDQIGFDSPVVYGTVPVDAMQLMPLNNAAPPPITTGDMIMVSPVNGVMQYEGHTCQAIGFSTVP